MTNTHRQTGGNKDKSYHIQQEGLAVASIVRDVVVEMTPPRDDNGGKFGSEFAVN